VSASAARPGPVSDEILRHFTRGKEHPRGVVWFGARSFYGHIRHFVASAIAAESVDSRDWMTPDDPRELLARITEVLGGDRGAASLVEGLGRDVSVDFVADTGDDVAVSRAVAALVFAPYELPDPDRPGEFLLAPRGEILLFGGDTAYPVATAEEITNRVIAPWNQVLQALPDDGRRRVLLGVAGNHDWYDGLDGFGRMFRRRPPGDEARPNLAGISQPMIQHHAEWALEFVRGGKVDKPRALVLSGYTPVQNATYFALTLAPSLELLAIDRQLTDTDSRQQRFLGDYYQQHPAAATLAVLPDPVYPFGGPSRTGTKMVEDLHLDLASRDTFVLTGDIHHYERLERGKLLHVIAGGGGAFLHPARIARGGLARSAVWPGVAQCRRLLRRVPWKLARGRSGFLPHLCLLVLFAPAVAIGAGRTARTGLMVLMAVSMTVILGGIYSLIGGVVRRKAVALLALGAALITAAIPLAGAWAVHLALGRLGRSASTAVLAGCGLIIAAFVGALIFGGYLSLLTLLGYENTQAFTVLDHPGFKHFLRLRVRADGRGIDGWCVGAADPLGAPRPVLVDHFTWRPASCNRGA
jgi:hypothetical protein